MAECAIAAAVSKVNEDAIKVDAEQYLGSDDPDNDDPDMKPGPLRKNCYKYHLTQRRKSRLVPRILVHQSLIILLHHLYYLGIMLV